ncbi:MAG: hypothetical protein ACSW8A_10600 [Lachnospiraceae bacterium]
MRMEQVTIRVLNKLFAQGYVSERQIADLTVTEILALPGISIAEIEKITQLQKAVKQKKVIAFLAGVKEKEPEGKDTKMQEKGWNMDGTEGV